MTKRLQYGVKSKILVRNEWILLWLDTGCNIRQPELKLLLKQRMRQHYPLVRLLTTIHTHLTQNNNYLRIRVSIVKYKRRLTRIQSTLMPLITPFEPTKLIYNKIHTWYWCSWIFISLVMFRSFSIQWRLIAQLMPWICSLLTCLLLASLLLIKNGHFVGWLFMVVGFGFWMRRMWSVKIVWFC